MKKRLILRPLGLALALICSLGAPLSGQNPVDDAARLKQQIEQLNQENEQLRQALAQSSTGTPLATSAAAVSSSAAQPKGLTHWMTSSSGKRHNSTCRWFHNATGRPCGPNDGISCKVCGG